MKKTIYFDMDGTIADLYGQNRWLEDIIDESPKPFLMARPMVNMRKLAAELNRVKAMGWTVGIISWTPRDATQSYAESVRRVKMKWLRDWLHDVEIDDLQIVEYGTCKAGLNHADVGILFDDEARNRTAWEESGMKAFHPSEIFEVLNSID